MVATLGVHPVDRSVEFKVFNLAENTVGGKLFAEKMGVHHAKQFMRAITEGVWDFIFWQGDGIKLQKLNLFIDQISRISHYSVEIGNKVYEIHVSAVHIENYKDSAKEEIQMILTYEIARLLQNTAHGRIPVALRHGIAAFVVISYRFKPSRWVDYGEGDRWDQSADVTGQFLFYCNRRYAYFIERLNKKMNDNYQDDYFVDLTEKTIEELWGEYKDETDQNGAGR